MSRVAIMSKNPLFTAQSFVSLHYKKNKQLEYLNWIQNFDKDFFYDFVELGLIPFLNRYGYSISLQTQTLVQFLKEWAFAFVYTQHHKSFQLYRNYTYCFHNGGMEDFDYFTFKISPDDWEDFLHQWRHTEFMDDSEAGFEQKSEFYMFAWRIIDLFSSKTYIKYSQLQDEYDDLYDDNYYSSAQPVDENLVYGGDRRTYS
jgi:hypothetical protein